MLRIRTRRPGPNWRADLFHTRLVVDSTEHTTRTSGYAKPSGWTEGLPNSTLA
jgi:hypothetical protein